MKWWWVPKSQCLFVVRWVEVSFSSWPFSWMGGQVKILRIWFDPVMKMNWLVVWKKVRMQYVCRLWGNFPWRGGWNYVFPHIYLIIIYYHCSFSSTFSCNLLQLLQFSRIKYCKKLHILFVLIHNQNSVLNIFSIHSNTKDINLIWIYSWKSEILKLVCMKLGISVNFFWWYKISKISNYEYNFWCKNLSSQKVKTL